MLQLPENDATQSLIKRQCMPNISKKSVVFYLIRHIFYLRQLNAVELYSLQIRTKILLQFPFDDCLV